mgnify:CR=1 FL=1
MIGKNDLQNKLKSSLNEFRENSEILNSLVLSSNISGKVNNFDLYYLISTYKSIVESMTLLKLHNEFFEDKEMKDLERKFFYNFNKVEESIENLYDVLNRKFK